MQERGKWSSKFGFILAAAGSAIGLGNIWRFPYITGSNGGGAFVFIYLLCIFIIAFPVMISELAIGRTTEKNPVGAFQKLAPKSPWVIIGFLGVLTGFGILSYYSVVAGWTIAYIIKAASGSLLATTDAAKVFSDFAANGTAQVTYLVIFMLFTVVVVAGGVKDGIEKAAKILLPVLFVLMLFIIGYEMTLPTAIEGIKFYILPDFSKVTPNTIITAMGQAFFSLSLGMGAMLTYGSYLRKGDNLLTSAMSVTIFDTIIAIMAGFMIFPALGGAPENSGPSLIFVVLVDVFKHIPFGSVVAVLFFVLLAIAALTSTVSLLEVVTAYFVDEKNISRKKAVVIVGFITALIGIPSALSLGSSQFLTKLGVLGKMDYIFGNISLTLGGFLICVFIIWGWTFKRFSEALGDGCVICKNKVFLLMLKIAIYIISPLSLGGMFLYILITGKTLG